MPSPAQPPQAAAPAPALPPRAPASPDAAIRGHLLAVWRYLRMHGATAPEADDLAQETFVIALQKQAQTLPPAAFATFLQRTARFLFLRRRRSGKPAELLADAIDALWARDAAHDGGHRLLDTLRTCLGELTDRARRAVELAYGLGANDPTSRRDLAEALGLHPDGVKTLMQRVRKTLRDCIERRRT